ncbi:MAG: hypothetical protein F6K04_09530 [Leptolyngbya sp. SIO4C5]|nr:hypothetical protein [Leptolyngbya sp. SIO4C5]
MPNGLLEQVAHRFLPLSLRFLALLNPGMNLVFVARERDAHTLSPII